MPANYLRPNSLRDAAQAASRPGARLLGGGTDLLASIEAGIDHAELLVDVSRLAELEAIRPSDDGALSIGAAVRLEDLAADERVSGQYAALADAARAVGTPALRASGTVGGNLAQRPRCWYLRSRFPCFKNGGEGCPAEHGENQYHAILGGGPCFAAHPSDVAVALLALDAVVVVQRATALRRVTVAELYAGAATERIREAAVEPGEIIAAVELPAASAAGAQRFAKLTQRGAWDFATVSLAGVRRRDGTVRLVLGGVAPGPWRVNPSVEEDVASGELDEESADALASRALHDARPLELNGYKVTQAEALLRRAMLDLSRQ